MSKHTGAHCTVCGVRVPGYSRRTRSIMCAACGKKRARIIAALPEMLRLLRDRGTCGIDWDNEVRALLASVDGGES